MKYSKRLGYQADSIGRRRLLPVLCQLAHCWANWLAPVNWLAVLRCACCGFVYAVRCQSTTNADSRDSSSQLNIIPHICQFLFGGIPVHKAEHHLFSSIVVLAYRRWLARRYCRVIQVAQSVPKWERLRRQKKLFATLKRTTAPLPFAPDRLIASNTASFRHTEHRFCKSLIVFLISTQHRCLSPAFAKRIANGRY